MKKKKKKEKNGFIFFNGTLHNTVARSRDSKRAKVADRFATLSLQREIIAGESEDEDDA